MALTPRARISRSRLVRYPSTLGAMYAFRTADDARSYSRHSRATSWESVTDRLGTAAFRISRALSSWTGFT